MIRTIRLYGELGKKYGRVHRLHVSSPAEAVRLLCANYKDMRQHIVDSDGIVGYEVWDGKLNLNGDNPATFHKQGDGSIKIIPRVHGAGNVGKIIAGVALIVLSIIQPEFLPLSQTLWSGMFSFGASLVLGGVIGMMTKTASGSSIESTEDNTQSYLFSGALNTTKQGNPVYIAYGTHLLGSQVISASLTTTDVPV